jgi:hypothetical protein
VSSRFAGWTALVVALWLMTPIAAAGQTPPPAQPPGAPGQPMPVRPPAEILEPGELRVFLDCQWECDFDYLRREITFVDHVRDSQSADIHVLVTTETTGGGGMRWKLQFIGLGRFQGHDEAVTFVTAQTDSPDMRRRALARWLRLGLATHAAKVHGRPDLDIAHPAHDETATPGATPPVTDPWDNWVINLNLSGNLSGEALSKSNSQRVNVSASRVTDAWRISVGGSWNRNTNTFQVSETSTVRSFTSSWSSNTLVVKSLGPKWSAAARSALSGSTFSNYDLTARAMMGLEYDIFPYAESTRRSLTFMYMVGAAHYDFEAETIFDRLDETHPEHALGASLGLRQPWGSLGIQSQLSQFLDDPGKNRFNTYGDADVRLFKGFSFNVYGSYSRIRDQVNLRKGEATPEEVLLRQRQLATGYSYYMGFGVTYRFGSIFNNVVNPRFRNFF